MTETPEQALWRAVIERAAIDANGRDRPCGNPDEARARRRAYFWIKGDSEDFRTVCALAGLDPDYVREQWLTGELPRRPQGRAAA